MNISIRMSRQRKLKYQELPLYMRPMLHVGNDTLTGRCRRARDRGPATPLLHFHTTYMYKKYVNAYMLNIINIDNMSTRPSYTTMIVLSSIFCSPLDCQKASICWFCWLSLCGMHTFSLNLLVLLVILVLNVFF